MRYVWFAGAAYAVANGVAVFAAAPVVAIGDALVAAIFIGNGLVE